jgi:arylsulfatase A-like enzyme
MRLLFARFCRLESSRRGIGTRTDYVAVIERVDWGVGQLLDVLRDHPTIQGNCLTIFTCDHGGAEMSTVGESGVHLQQGFATLWEGGLRIPLIMHWPGVLQPPPGGGVVSTPAIMMDLTVTLLELAGLGNGPAFQPSQLDGISLLPHIDRATYTANASTMKPDLPGTGVGGPVAGATGMEHGETQDRVFHWRLNLPLSAAWASGQRRAVRRGRWKYLWDGGFGYLFDLIDDPAETVNLYSRHETLARELEALSLTDW